MHPLNPVKPLNPLKPGSSTEHKQFRPRRSGSLEDNILASLKAEMGGAKMTFDQEYMLHQKYGFIPPSISSGERQDARTQDRR